MLTRDKLIPGCAWMPLTENQTQPLYVKRLFIFHSAVGAGSLRKFFEGRTNLESTGWTGKQGDSEQYMSLDARADANYRVNDIAVSWETADNGDPDSDPWSEPQMDELVRIAYQAHLILGIPLVKATSPFGSGFGFHTMFGAPSDWTPVAKSCPGRIRKLQFPEILARANALKAAAEAPKPVLPVTLPTVEVPTVLYFFFAGRIYAWNGERATHIKGSAAWRKIQAAHKRLTGVNPGWEPLDAESALQLGITDLSGAVINPSPTV